MRGVRIVTRIVGSPGEDIGDQAGGKPSWYQVLRGCSAKRFHERSSRCRDVGRCHMGKVADLSALATRADSWL